MVIQWDLLMDERLVALLGALLVQLLILLGLQYLTLMVERWDLS